MSKRYTPDELGELVVRGELSEGDAAEIMSRQIREDAVSTFYGGQDPQNILHGNTAPEPSVDDTRLQDVAKHSQAWIVLAAILGTALLTALLYALTFIA